MFLQIIKGGQQQNTCFVLQQLLDLNKLQLTDKSDHSLLIHGQVKTDTCFSMHHPTKKFDVNLGQPLQHAEDLHADLQQRDNPLQELKSEAIPFPFAQLEQSPSSSTAGLPLHGESFWQCKSPVQSSQV